MSFGEDTVILLVLPSVGSVIAVNLLKSPFVPSLPITIIPSLKSVVSSLPPAIGAPPPAVPFKVITPPAALSPIILFTNPRCSINVSFSLVTVVSKLPDKNIPSLITISTTSAPLSIGNKLLVSGSKNRTVSPKTLVPISIPLVSESVIKLVPATVSIV